MDLSVFPIAGRHPSVLPGRVEMIYAVNNLWQTRTGIESNARSSPGGLAMKGMNLRNGTGFLVRGGLATKPYG